MGEILSCINCKFKSSAACVLGNNDLETLDHNRAGVQFKKGDIIFKESALSSNIIFLRTGLVKLHMMGPSREQILKIAKAPSFLGIPTTIGDQVNHYSATALKDVTACFIDREVFKEFIHTNGNFAYEIILNLCQYELRNYSRFVNSGQKQMHGRIADALLYFARYIFENKAFELPLSRSDFGQLTNISRESVSRILTEFNKENIIRLQGKNIEILKEDLLESISKNG